MTGNGGFAGPSGAGAGVAASGAYPPAADVPNVRLTVEQIELLRREGEVRPTVAGEVLFREGTAAMTSS